MIVLGMVICMIMFRCHYVLLWYVYCDGYVYGDVYACVHVYAHVYVY